MCIIMCMVRRNEFMSIGADGRGGPFLTGPRTITAVGRLSSYQVVRNPIPEES